MLCDDDGLRHGVDMFIVTRAEPAHLNVLGDGGGRDANLINILEFNCFVGNNR